MSEEGQAKGLPLERKKRKKRKANYKLKVESTPSEIGASPRRIGELTAELPVSSCSWEECFLPMTPSATGNWQLRILISDKLVQTYYCTAPALLVLLE